MPHHADVPPGGLPRAQAAAGDNFTLNILEMTNIPPPQTRCLVDFPGPKLPSVTSGELQRYLLEVIAPQVRCAALRAAALCMRGNFLWALLWGLCFCLS